MKQGCQLCHQIGDLFTRDISHLAAYKFKNSEEAWATRFPRRSQFPRSFLRSMTLPLRRVR